LAPGSSPVDSHVTYAGDHVFAWLGEHKTNVAGTGARNSALSVVHWQTFHPSFPTLFCKAATSLTCDYWFGGAPAVLLLGYIALGYSREMKWGMMASIFSWERPTRRLFIQHSIIQ